MAGKTTFRATIPPIMSGIKTGGDGMRVQFDIPESDMAQAIELLTMRGKVLIISVEVQGNGRDSARKIHI